MTENLSSLTISPFIHDSPNRRPVRSAVHNPPMMGKRIIFIFILFSEVEEEDGGRDDQHEKEGRRRVENIAGSKKKKREGWGEVEASVRCFRRCDWSIRLVSFIPACDPLPSPYKLVFEFLFRFWRCTGREKLAKKCWIDDNLATALVHNSIRALSLSRSKTFGYPVRAVGAVNLYHRPGRTCLSESGTAVCIRDHSLALFPFLFFSFHFSFFSSSSFSCLSTSCRASVRRL